MKNSVKVNIKNAERAHTPITSEEQAGLFGADLARAKAGKQTKTGMSIAELERHLREWGGKRNAKEQLEFIPVEDRRNAGKELYGSKLNVKPYMNPQELDDIA